MNAMCTQRGVTMVELLISLVIGLFVIAGVGQVYLSGRAAANLQERMSNLQENGRFALTFLQRSLQKSDYQPYPNLMPASSRCSQPILNASDALSTSPDTFTVCYQGDAGVSDCLGTSAASGVVNDRYFISTDATTGVRSLSCQGIANTQPLVEGIENMQVLYGVDANSDGLADQYLNAGSVTNWKQVVAVRVAVLASTNSNDASASGVVFGDTASDVRTYQLLDQALPSSTLSTGVRGRVFMSTVQLRNQAVN